MNFTRQSLGTFICLVLVTFLASLFGKLTGHNDIALLVVAVGVCCFVLRAVWYYQKWRQISSLINCGQFEKAITLCLQVRKHYPRDINLCVTTSAAYGSLSKWEKSAEFADLGLSLDPRNARAYTCRGVARTQLNQPGLALGDCSKAIEFSGKMPRPLQAHLIAARATAHSRAGDNESAIADCDRALEMDPKCAVALLSRGHCRSITKQFDQALSDLDKLSKLSPAGIMKGLMLCLRARVYLSMGDSQAAIENATEAVVSGPNSPTVLSTRGLVLARVKRYDEALIDLSKAIEIDPHNAEAFWFRHEVYEALARYDDANADKEIAKTFQYRPYL